MGHAEGDTYIEFCVRQIMTSIGKTDLVFRIGGDEFLILMPKTSSENAVLVADTIRTNAAFCKKEYPFHAGLSVGYSTVTEFPYNVHALKEAANNAMYKDKRSRKSTSTDLPLFNV